MTDGDLNLCDLPPEDLIGERVVVTSYDGRERTGVLVDIGETASEHDDRALRVEFDERRTTYFVGEGRNDRVRLTEDAAIDENPEPVPDGGAVNRDRDPSAPIARVDAALKQLRLAKEDLDDRALEIAIGDAIHGISAVERSLSERDTEGERGDADGE